jgi:hypothetical protein
MLGNTLGTWETCWKLDENIVGISWEHIRNNKNPTPPPSPERKIKSWVYVASPHWLQEFSFNLPMLLGIFGLG